LGIRLSTNVASIGVNRQLSQVNKGRDRTLEKLSSGSRIVRAADDAAGLAISEQLKAGIRSFQVAVRNSTDGISLLQTAEGGINEVQNILIRLREMAVQASSDTLGDAERSYVNQEFQALKSEAHRIASTTSFNGTKLLNGQGSRLDFQVGINSKSFDRLSFSPGDTNLTPTALGIGQGHVATKESARMNLDTLDKAIGQVNLHRSYLGSVNAALSSNVQNMSVSRENTAQANSRVRDADMAEWTAQKVKEDIIVNAGGAVLSQANNLHSNALKLLKIDG